MGNSGRKTGLQWVLIAPNILLNALHFDITGVRPVLQAAVLRRAHLRLTCLRGRFILVTKPEITGFRLAGTTTKTITLKRLANNWRIITPGLI